MIDEKEQLIAWIEHHYPANVANIHPLAVGWKKVYRIEQKSGEDWVMRAYPPPDENSLPVDVEGLAAVLLFLEAQAYPAERVIRSLDQAKLVQWDGWQVLMTTFLGQPLAAWQSAVESPKALPLPANNAEGAYAPELLFGLSAAIARLHRLPFDAAMPRAGMLPSKELAWANTNLINIADQVPEPLQAEYQQLVAAVQQADRLEDLPFALIHNDCNPSNAVLTAAGEISLIDWESAGRGPALVDVGILLSNCFNKQTLRIEHTAVDAIVDGYCQDRIPNSAELEHLADAIRFFRLVLLAGYFPERISQTVRADELIYGATYQQWQAQYEASVGIANLAHERFARYV